MSESNTVVIVGGGPAGLTAALELLRKTDYKPIVFELESQVGGISKTVNHNGNRMDLGGHRFFSKSDWVMRWWQEILPVNISKAPHLEISYQNKRNALQLHNCQKANGDKVMLLRPRLSRILYLGKFFDYPLKINLKTMLNLGVFRMVRIGVSYMSARFSPIKEEKTLEDFMINRFGRILYQTFFKDYTEKVWGVPCDKISSEWGAQRIKGLSISRALKHAIGTMFFKYGIEDKSQNTSLIEQFLYPKYGPGQMWEEVAAQVEELGGQVVLNTRVTDIYMCDGKVTSVKATNNRHEEIKVDCNHLISTMPVKELIESLNMNIPAEVKEVSDGLIYRDFITLGVLVDKLKWQKSSAHLYGEDAMNLLPDNWIYVQERAVKLGRIQIFNNWAESLVESNDKVWLGLEYFCNEGDDLWIKSDQEFTDFAIGELVSIGLIDSQDVSDTKLVKVKKAYPAYFGTYDRFSVIQDFVDNIDNLFLVGRNGMHRYNNQDHSMLTAKSAVEHIRDGLIDRSSIWSINVDDEYHEEVAETTA